MPRRSAPRGRWLTNSARRAGGEMPGKKGGFAGEDYRVKLRGDVAVEEGSLFDGDAHGGQDGIERERALRSAFASPAANGSHVRSIECRATRCRVQVDFDDLDTDIRVIGALFLSQASTTPMAFTVPTRERRADGSVGATMYFRTKDAVRRSSL